MLSEVAKTYFETYLEGWLSDLNPGEVRLCTSDRRYQKEEGWGYVVAIWAFLIDDACVISVRQDLKAHVARAMEALVIPRDILSEIVQSSIQSACDMDFRIFDIDILLCAPGDLILHSCPGCRQLSENDLESYVAFKKVISPNCDIECCKRDILRNICDGIAFGVFRDTQMVSNASAPHIGIMQDRIEELGVETLPDCRRLGYGKSALSHTTEAILDLDRVPIYRLSKSNVASLRTAQSAGYHRVAESVLFTHRG